MKLKFIYTFFSITLLFALFMSASSGPAAVQGADRTGNPMGNGTCGNNGCHATGAFSPSLSLRLIDANNNAVSEYEAGVTYTLSVSVSASEGSPARYGFQAVAVDTNNDNSGNFTTNPPTGTQVTQLNSRQYAEHSTSSTSNSFSIEWTAPVEALGEVTFYAAGIAANGNGGSSGDGAANSSLKLNPATSSALFQVEALALDIQVFPNPVQERLNAVINSELTGNFALNIFDNKGQLIKKDNIRLNTGENQLQIAADNWAKGQYFLQITDGIKTNSISVLKL